MSIYQNGGEQGSLKVMTKEFLMYVRFEGDY
jgi:hypothetical protein